MNRVTFNHAAPERAFRREAMTLTEGEALPGHDARCDSARHYAAVGIFSLAVLSVLGVAVGAYAFGGADAYDSARTPFGPAREMLTASDLLTDGLSAVGLSATGVGADAPMLRPGFGVAGIAAADGEDTGAPGGAVMNVQGALDAAATVTAAPARGEAASAETATAFGATPAVGAAVPPLR
ncbi:hypothetical protein [Ancylobacter moscoviensis]